MMPDYESWRSANQPQGFSLFDYVHAIMSTNDLPTDLLLAMARLLWPEFVAFDGMVFLKEQFSLARVQEHGRSDDESTTEYWINLLSVDGFFSYSHSDKLSQDEAFANILAEAWRAKLRADFPDRSFDVKVMVDESVGDILLTFTSVR